MLSCDRTYINESENGSSYGGNNNLKTGQIEIKAYPNKYNNKVEFYITAKKVTIDWGDGNVDVFTPNGVYTNFSHEYPNRNLQTILVSTEGMSGKGVTGNSIENSFGSGFSYDSDFTEIRFGYCPELKSIFCYGEKLTVLDISKCTALVVLQHSSFLHSHDTYLSDLTSLDVSKCTALRYLYCTGSKLSASALNSIFNSLPTRSPDDNARIYCGFNQGSATCDITIAEKKGWKVYNQW